MPKRISRRAVVAGAVAWPVAAAAMATAVLTVITGCIASYGILDRKPLDILRQIES